MTVAQIDLPAGSRLETFRYDLTDPDGNLTGELNPVVTDQGSNVAPAVRTSIRGQANRVLTLEIVPDQAADLDPRLDRIAPYWVDTDGTAYPLGVYRILDVTASQFSGGDRIELTCGSEDSTHHTPNTRSLSWGQDTPVSEIIDQLAGVLGIGEVDADETTGFIGEPLAFPVGSTDWYDIYANVAAAAGMLTPFFTLAGVWRWRIVPEWETAAPDHIYSTDPDAPQAEQKIVQQSLVRSVTLLDSPNVFYAINTAARGARIVGSYRLPATAPNSVERVGEEIAAFVEVASLASTAAANNAARALAAQTLSDIGTGSMNTPLDARHELYDTVEADGLLYQENGTGVRLAPGEEMGHDLTRIYRASDPEPSVAGVL